MIEKRIRYFDEGGDTGGGWGSESRSADSRGNEGGSGASNTGGDSSGFSHSGSDPNQMGPQPQSAPDDGQAPEYNWGTIGKPLTADQLAGGTENAKVDALADIDGYNPDGFDPQYGTSLGGPEDMSPVGTNWTFFDRLTDALPSWQTAGNIASMFVPALRPVMMAANTAKSVSEDASVGNIASNLLAAPLAKATGLNTGAIASLFKGDVGNAVGSQVVGTAMGDINKAIGPEAARMLGLANSATGASSDVRRGIATALNNAINDRSTSTTQAQGLSPAEASYALQGRGGDTGMLAAAPARSSPVVASISNILGVKPVAARGKNAPIDIVQQLMAMQNQPGNLESVPASTGGSIDDLIRLTRS